VLFSGSRAVVAAVVPDSAAGDFSSPEPNHGVGTIAVVFVEATNAAMASAAVTASPGALLIRVAMAVTSSLPVSRKLASDSVV